MLDSPRGADDPASPRFLSIVLAMAIGTANGQNFQDYPKWLLCA
jgi:hypothetical protein